MHGSGSYVVPEEIKERYIFDGDREKLFSRVVDTLFPEDTSHPFKAEFLENMVSCKFIPAGNTLVAGKKPIQPNCSILGEIYDENFDIKLFRAEALWKVAIGVGFDLSGCSNPVETLRKLSSANNNISLDWKRPRRGNMATLNVRHSKVIEFIKCKTKSDSVDGLYNFNISVTVDNAFMDNVLADDASEDAKLFRIIAESAHKFGDPGIIFLDRVQGPHNEAEGKIVTAVPCGEQYMYTNETCNLCSINLDRFVTPSGEFDFEDYHKVAKLGVRFLDAVIDSLDIPDDALKEKSVDLRRVGLGVMGFATALETMNIPYESENALNFGEKLASVLADAAATASKELATELGPYVHSVDRRNITSTCIAPTGGIRLLTASDGFGIEPLFKEVSTISPEFAVRMVGVWQKHIENAISKTINLQSTASVEDVMQVFKYAYKCGCKGKTSTTKKCLLTFTFDDLGITVYRNKCRQNQPLTICDGDLCK